MGLTRSSIVDTPRAGVLAWHERPGAIVRLTPPWMPIRIEQEADDLSDGTAVLGFPLGLRWVARHTDAESPDGFLDQLDSAPLRWAIRWRHHHEFEALDSGRTRVTDRIDTNVPGFLLKSMLAYRHRQLADDLAAAERATAEGMRPLTVAVTGSSGTIGRELTALLSTSGHEVVRLVRHRTEVPGERHWDPEDPAPTLLRGVNAVIHLAGASIAGRFTDEHRRRLEASRLGPTRKLAQLAAGTEDGPTSFVSASAIGYYGPDRGDEELTETSPPGEGFLAGLVQGWEEATEPAAEAGLRVVQVRTGLVQTPAGGTLKLQYPLFAAGLGGPLGDGKQWQSWIGIDDLLDIYHRAIFDQDLAGPVNAVATDPVRNDEYTATLARVLHRPALLKVPDLGPRILLGDEGAEELAQASQLVVPRVLTARGHKYRRPHLEDTLRHVLGRTTD
ncbi:hypothetical protein FB561_5763 [Kribbella amoyensis]|uniref:TIGR01777 family protein n=1 Tax=Kribbella amoyensis TaxID=996641 RepID=A0A561C0E5_9ACTN|nr:TIGR01777 family oxidoreductase [Kribbella amoyensis]TWD84570.1 hypothetical protein FB561_5763 [Kribbella amoyensis]